MTEDEWLSSTADPAAMLKFAWTSGRASERKLRLFGCACTRSHWDLLTEECFRRAVEVAERFADGLAHKKELNMARKESGAALASRAAEWRSPPTARAFGCAWSCTRTPVGSAAMYPLWVLTDEPDRRRDAALLRDLFGPLPFREVHLDPSLLTWNAGAVRALAQAVYDDREMPSGEFKRERVAQLADELELAECRDDDVLGHLREQGGVHVRGCWCIDLLLSKS
jgi:hypothetical protein